MSIAIVTDSTSDIPKDIAEQHGITVVPLNVRFGMEEFKDGIDIDNDEFYRRQRLSPRPATFLPHMKSFWLSTMGSSPSTSRAS
jgi:fatty acid-binding protein DegV